MKGELYCSERPYVRAYERERKLYPHVVRIVPREFGFSFEWISEGDKNGDHSIYLRLRGEKDFSFYAKTNEKFTTINNLKTLTEYEFYIENEKGQKSTVRIVKTGKQAKNSTCLTYLHPEDKTFSFSGYSMLEPTFVRLPSGAFVASVSIAIDRHEWNADPILTQIYRSDDEGATWVYQCDIIHSWNGSLFINGDRLYFLNLYSDYSDLVISESKDEGKTWSQFTTIAKGESPKGWGWHLASTPFFRHEGRIYHQLEYGHVAQYAKDSKELPEGYILLGDKPFDLAHHVSVLSADEDADLMNPESWTIAELYYPKETDPYQCIEGNIFVSPDGKMKNLLRTMRLGVSLLTEYDYKNPENPVKFVKEVTNFPLSAISKFDIKRDKETGTYIAFGNDLNYGRSRLIMCVSKDSENWDIALEVANGFKEGNAFSYPFWDFDGDDILLMSRTAYNGAVNQHDTNTILLHRIKDYKKYLKVKEK